MDTNRRGFLGTTAATALVWSGLGCSLGGSSSPAPSRASGLIRLDANENPHGPSAQALAAARDALAESCRYTDADQALVAAIAKHHGLSPQHVVLGTGSYAILTATVLATLRGGGSTVVAHPTFGAVAEYATAFGPVTRVPLDGAARHDLDAMAAAIDPATKLVYVCNPNNPTSTLLPASDVTAFCRRFAARTRVIVDEAYAEYVPGFTSMAQLVREGLPIVVVRTFSKLYGLAGLRVGYALAPPALATLLRTARGGPDKVWLGVTGARAALASLDDAAYVARIQRAVGATRTKFVAALERLGLRVPTAHASFVYFRHPRPEAVATALAARQIKIAARTDIGGCRITIGLPAEMTTAAEALAAVLPTLT